MVKQRMFILALAAALLVLLLIGSVAFADGLSAVNAQTQAKGPVCVDGYVINHREQAVDGTRTTPPLVVQAVLSDTAATTPTVAAAVPVGANGYFKFPNLAVGAYDFRLALPPGWDGIAPQAGLSGPDPDGTVAATGFTQLAKSDTCYRIVFKIRRLVDIPVLKWEEQLDGTVSPGEGWTITASPVNDPFAKVVTTATVGGQAVLTLTPGTWNVAETVKPGWTPLSPPAVTRIVDQYQPFNGVAINPIVFKNRAPVCHPKIIVTKIGHGWDANGQSTTLGTLAGWKFTVSRADKQYPPVTKTTGGDGRAIFDGLYPGVYIVTETVQPGWEVMDENPQTVVLYDCETFPVTFNNQELIGELTIYGKKLFKAWEKPFKGTLVGLPGWTITAQLLGTDAVTSTVTNALGEYRFTQDQLVKAGMAFPGATIKVCEEDRTNWIHVTPNCVNVTFPYPIPPTYKGAKVDFTNVQDPPLPSGTAYRAPARSAGANCSSY